MGTYHSWVMWPLVEKTKLCIITLQAMISIIKGGIKLWCNEKIGEMTKSKYNKNNKNKINYYIKLLSHLIIN